MSKLEGYSITAYIKRLEADLQYQRELMSAEIVNMHESAARLQNLARNALEAAIALAAKEAYEPRVAEYIILEADRYNEAERRMQWHATMTRTLTHLHAEASKLLLTAETTETTTETTTKTTTAEK